MAMVKTFVFMVLVKRVLSQELEYGAPENKSLVPKAWESSLSTADVEQYARNYDLVGRDASESLLKFKSNFNWKANETILATDSSPEDLCLLKKFIPNDYQYLRGTIKDPDLINYANQRLNDTRSSYIALDIGENLMEEHKKSFDHIFSFYTLDQFKHKQKKVFQNIYDMLTDGGETFNIFQGYIVVIDVMRFISKSNKIYKEYFKDVDDFIGAYQYLQDPGKDVKSIMECVGFENVIVNVEEKFFEYDRKATVESAAEFVNNFGAPSEVYEQFVNDFLAVARALGAVQDNGQKTMLNSSYILINAFGRKPVRGSS